MGVNQVNSVDPYTIESRPRRAMHLYERARSAWGPLGISRKQFLDHLQERAPHPGQLDGCRVEDLYLACGCAHGDPEALQIFEKQYLTRLKGKLARDRRPPSLIEEICQQVRVSLLVAEPGRLPRIATYAGRGTLFNWIAVAAQHEARRLSPPGPLDLRDDWSAIIDTVPGFDNPETASIRNCDKDELRKAFGDAVSSLTPEDRGLLKMNAIDGVSTTALGLLHGVSQSTISRRLTDIRERIGSEMERLGVSPRDYRSMLRLLESNASLGISQILSLHSPSAS